jgi:nucleotide-binding universal stress UspA family protein
MTYTKLLVPLEGSRLSEGALPYARWLARSFDLPVELLHAIDPDLIRAFTNPAKGHHFDTVETEMVEGATSYLQGLAGTFPAPSSVRCFVETGKPAEVIVGRASTEPEALIAMATRGHSGIQRWQLGSVASKVLQSAANPMLLVREGEPSYTGGEARLRSALVPLDGSELAESVLPHVRDLAALIGLEVILVRVHTLFIESLRGEAYSPDVESILEQAREEAGNYLEKIAGRLRAEGVKVSTVALEGNAAAEIINLAQRTPDNLVAMSSHGRSGLTRWLLGSVADRVIRHSGDPVLVIRPRPKE